MRLALATLSIVRIDAADHTGPRRGRSGSNILPRSNSIHPIKTWRPSAGLVACWHVSPETGRIECRWSLEEPPAGDHLCAALVEACDGCPQLRYARRYGGDRRSPAVTNLSANP